MTLINKRCNITTGPQLHPAFGLLVQSHSPLCSFTLQGQIRGTSATLAFNILVGWGLTADSLRRVPRGD